MPSADKRARKKENARAAREVREAAFRRKKRTRSTITVAIVVALFVGVIVLLNVTGSDKKKPAAASTSTAPTPATLDASKTYTATIKTNFGVIKLAMNTKDAPIAASHFVELARKGVYNGSRWHRVINAFVIQGGAPGGDPSKDYGTSVVGEVPKGKYAVGDVAAAKTGSAPNGTFDSQFFIVTGPQGVALPPQYADFAHVTAGMDVVRKIEQLRKGADDDPIQKATIDKVTITES
jgi:cyclophilin family peptidyl-prolyl cis-trans isomerase